LSVKYLGKSLRKKYPKPKPLTRKERAAEVERLWLYRAEHGHALPKEQKRKRQNHFAYLDKPENSFVFEGVIAHPPLDSKAAGGRWATKRRMAMFHLAYRARFGMTGRSTPGSLYIAPITAFGEMADLVLDTPWQEDRVLRVEGYIKFSFRRFRVRLIAREITVTSLGERNQVPPVDEAVAKLLRRGR
jgi:hypothetical protein